MVALSGERLAFREGALVIDGEEIIEPYVARPCAWSMPEVVVNVGECYVVGDNRTMAREDHLQGRVHFERIVGGPVF